MAVNPQHRCVFVGNIPYDATEEELVQLCEEVGPVVSFRLVTDKETGKPKGYGFCEYKDEETALSARRNLHNQEFHGRQLRVDFAENDKNADRSREQGRGGPGLATSTDPQKHFGGPAVRGDLSLLQPVGHSVSMNAASIMAGALGGAQTSINPSQSGLQMQPIGTDPLTLHLASMSKTQLNEILTDLKVMATQNKEQARQLLLANPVLSKAVFQAHLMLGMVSPQMLQMPNIRQVSGPHVQVLPQYGQGVQQTAVQTVSGIPPLAQHKLPIGFAPQPQSQTSALQQVTSLIPSQYSTTPLPTQPRFQTPLIAQHQVLQQPPLRGTLGVPTPPSLHPQPANLYNRHETQITAPLSVKQMRPPLVQHSGQIVSASPGTNIQLVASVQPSLLTRTPLGDNGFQTGPSIMSATPTSVNKDSGLHEKSSLVKDLPDKIYHPTKLMKLEDGRSASFSTADVHVSTSVSRQQMSKAGPADSSKQNPELPPDVDPALLQQVLNLTAEQLSLLPPEQRQEVIQLQQRYRQLG